MLRIWNVTVSIEENNEFHENHIYSVTHFFEKINIFSIFVSFKYLCNKVLLKKNHKSYCKYRIRIRMDPHSLGCPGFRPVLGMQIRIQEQGNLPKFTKKLISCLLKGLLYLCSYVFDLLPI